MQFLITDWQASSEWYGEEAEMELTSRSQTMDFQSWVAMAGMAIGTTLMVLGRRTGSPVELRRVGGFLLVVSLCYLLGLQIPKL